MYKLSHYNVLSWKTSQPIRARAERFTVRILFHIGVWPMPERARVVEIFVEEFQSLQSATERRMINEAPKSISTILRLLENRPDGLSEQDYMIAGYRMGVFEVLHELDVARILIERVLERAQLETSGALSDGHDR
jgi:hypothetical protein